MGVWEFQSWELCKVENLHLFADAFEDCFDELNVQGVQLIIVLRFLVGKNQIKGDLIRLVDNRPVAGHHGADVKMEHAGDRFEELICPFNQFGGGGRISGISPKDNNV